MFAGIDLSTIPLFSGGLPSFGPRKEYKMVVAMRADSGTDLESLPTGISAKMISEAVIRAY